MIEIDWAYAINAAAWSALGLAVGLSLGRIERIYLLGRSEPVFTTKEGITTMTTPERLRRRQYIEGALLVVIGVLMLLQSAYFHSVDQDQSECLETNFAALSKALDTRSELQEQESSATRNVLLAFAKAAREVDAPKKRQLENREKMIDALLEYDRITAHVQDQRDKHPFPPYPAGTCR